MSEPISTSASGNPAPSWTAKKPLRRFVRRRLEGWRLRHQLPFNFWIHLIGIPMALLAAPVLLFFFDWYWGVGAFVLGYLLQWVGHIAEGNDLGEWAAVKRLIGLPYVGISRAGTQRTRRACDRTMVPALSFLFTVSRSSSPRARNGKQESAASAHIAPIFDKLLPIGTSPQLD